MRNAHEIGLTVRLTLLTAKHHEPFCRYYDIACA
jgi:hypothetical protein